MGEVRGSIIGSQRPNASCCSPGRGKPSMPSPAPQPIRPACSYLSFYRAEHVACKHANPLTARTFLPARIRMHARSSGSMAPYKLYGQGSRVLKVRAVALFAGVELDIHPFTAGLTNRTPWYLAMNPNGKWPVLQTPGGALFESNVICRYLATAGSNTAFYPAATSPQVRAPTVRGAGKGCRGFAGGSQRTHADRLRDTTAWTFSRCQPCCLCLTSVAASFSRAFRT